MRVPLLWVGTDEVPAVLVNHFLFQTEQDEIFLTFGTLTPPVLLADTREELRQQVSRLGYVPVRTVGKFSLTPRRTRELIELLQRGLINYEQRQQ